MIPLIKVLVVLSIGTWSVATAQDMAAQQSPASAMDRIQIANLGLERQIPSATDLVESQDRSAGPNRAALIHRLRCWIDGTESCSVADRNDPRVRAIRRFLGRSPAGRHGVVVVHFPDQTRVEVHLVRVATQSSGDWTQSAYELEVRPNSVQAPELKS